MKKKLQYITFTVCFVYILAGCESFLDTESYTKQNAGNFPFTLEDAKKSLTGIYSTLSLAISDGWKSVSTVVGMIWWTTSGTCGPIPTNILLKNMILPKAVS